jgi:Lamin Tail Domain/Esterase-like activity of phytase
MWHMRISPARSIIFTVAIAALTLAGVTNAPAVASANPTANVKITEFAYGGLIAGSSVGGDGEYVEITNLGSTPADMTGWSYKTTATVPGPVSLSGLGILAPGESAIITDVTPAEFRTQWGLTDSVKIVNDGSTTLNKGPATMYLYDSGSALADSVSYASGFFSGKGVSAHVDAAHIGAEAGTTGWTISTAGDSESSWTSVKGAVGSPGISSLSSQSTAVANVKFTEFAYGGLVKNSSTGGDGEYVEVTNVGRTPVDMTGWSYKTTATVPGPVSLSSFGTLAPGESAIITDVTAAEFRTEWGLAASVKVVVDGSTTLNKGPATAYLYNAASALADSVTYASGFFSGKGVSAWVDAAHLGAEAGTTGWTISTAGDSEASWTSSNGAVGSPGASSFGIHAASTIHTTPGGGTTPPPTTDPNFADIVINEITSDNDSIGFAPLPNLSDAIELYNKGAHTVSLDGWKQVDSGPATSAAVFSAGLYVNGVLATSIPAGGYGVFQSTAGLSSGGDAVKIYTPDGTLVDELDYLAGQAGVDEGVNIDHTYKALAACTDGSNTFLEVSSASFGSSNAAACATGVTPLTTGAAPEAPCQTEDSGNAPGTVPSSALAWPGSATPVTIDAQCSWVTTESGQDLSGLAFDPANANVLYAVKNKSHVYRLLNSGGTWVKDTANGWANGKDIRFPGGTGAPDSEGLTVGPDGALYITTERDNNNSNVPLDSILRFDPTSTATTLTATDQWVLTSDLGFAPTDAADSNLGFEGVTYVPDSFLVGQGFRTDAGTLYDPANYAGKALPGLFFGAVEKTGHLIAYALNSDHSFTRVADISSGMLGVMDAQFDPDLGEIWAHCDNTCGNATGLLKIGADGHFTVDHYYARPANLPNYNLEGFAVAPVSTAVDGQRQVLWTDDGNRFGHSLWAGTIPVALPAPVAALSTTTAAPGQPITVTVNGLTPGTEYEADLHSAPVLLGKGVASSSGTLALTVTIPLGTATGAHTITISPTASPSTIVASVALTVRGVLAFTGTDPQSALLAGSLLLLLGAVLLIARNRRRRFLPGVAR